MMKTLQNRGRHTVLPIIGDTVAELTFSMTRPFEIVFQAADRAQSEIRIIGCIAVRRGNCDLLLEESWETKKPVKELSPLLELLGSDVADALALEDGRLQIAFSNKLALEVTPKEGEGWYFTLPRPGREFIGDRDHMISVIGAGGHLI